MAGERWHIGGGRFLKWFGVVFRAGLDNRRAHVSIRGAGAIAPVAIGAGAIESCRLAEGLCDGALPIGGVAIAKMFLIPLVAHEAGLPEEGIHPVSIAARPKGEHVAECQVC